MVSNEQLDADVLNALGNLAIVEATLYQQFSAEEYAAMIHTVHVTMINLHDAWRMNIGKPIYLKPCTLANVLRNLADTVEDADLNISADKE